MTSSSVPSLYPEPDALAASARPTYEPPIRPGVVQGKPAPIDVDQIPGPNDVSETVADPPYPGHFFAAPTASDDVPAGSASSANGMRVLARAMDRVRAIGVKKR
jgi:hypothetical protein